MRRVLIAICMLAALVLSVLPAQADGKGANVYVIPINDEVEKGLYAYLKRAINTAEKDNAELIIFDMNTPGGEVVAARDIGNLISSTKIKTVTFVNSWAISAGSYIALHTEEIYMTPNATMGASAIIDQTGNTAGEKAESMWIAAMSGVAQEHDRDPEIAKAMVTSSIDFPDLKENGKLLTLTAAQAEKVGYSEGTVKDLDELIAKLGYKGANVHKVEPTFAEKIARFITHPVVVPILLSIASLGLVLELYSPGFGLPGGMGLSALLLFFFGHYVAGLAGYESIILFVLGIILIAAEFFLAGGIAGLLGTVAVIGSIIMAGGNLLHMAISIVIALFLSILAIIIMLKVFGKRMNIFKKLILTDSTNTESGYVSNVNRLELIGREGVTITPLRPSGTVKVDDERLDVVAEGSFIENNTKVKVVKVEGSRIVVREI
ncbi:nodulation protein NfeD [Lederbergia wuyishanensis]|uniref:Membrane-bound serine protease (ClpP class) n=1 Tax=Lederbergia wuyishanensis TaxID=1347903 RepID=A0ABU0D1J0_9BACI|nr:nodulation protein NfeD [Lederbergia wuyishanensis]MCJ8006876.1 nodulation protein NfeD [Lederbergia wuyishanensis]MDQ0342260.1 membrane-bound serine protease (ClpP class) [Lederbergia wuyishanensis]